MREQEKPRCVATWLVADPVDCWLRQDCKYWNAIEGRCAFQERYAAEIVAARRAEDKNDRRG